MEFSLDGHSVIYKTENMPGVIKARFKETNTH